MSKGRPNPPKTLPRRAPRPIPSTRAPTLEVSSASRSRPERASDAVLLTVAMAMTSMHEQVHQRACHEQEVGQGTQHMPGMGDEQVEPERGNHQRERPTQRGPNKSCAPVSLGRLGDGCHHTSPLECPPYALVPTAALMQRK